MWVIEDHHAPSGSQCQFCIVFTIMPYEPAPNGGYLKSSVDDAW